MRSTDDRQLTNDSMRVGRRTLGLAVTAVASAVLCSAAPAAAAPHAAAKTPTAGSHHHHPAKHHHHHPAKHHHHPAKHHHRRHHKAKTHLQNISVDGLVTNVHKSDVTVFASSATIGHHTTQNTTVHLTLGAKTRGTRGLHKGYVVHLVAYGKGSTSHLIIPKLRSEHVTPSPATAIVGFVQKVGAGSLLISQVDRLDGARDHGGQRHPLTVDTSTATVTVDGKAGTPTRGEFVTVLGEVEGNNVVAAHVYLLSGEVEPLIGTVKAIKGDDVTVRSWGYNTKVQLGAASDAPLLIDGASATTSQLRTGDRIVVLGVISTEEEGFVPVVGFGFDGHDHGPCGTNPAPRRQRHDG